MGGANFTNKESSGTGNAPKDGPAAQETQNGQGSQQAQASPPATLEPKLATDFTTWWLGQAMDMNPQSAAANHEKAFAWMSPETITAFKSAFWAPDLSEGITSGSVIAAFHPSAIQAQAINPDGSVVVSVCGTFVVQRSGQPVMQQVQSDYLVRKEKDGLRIGGMYNRVVNMPGSSVF
jgi:hypothetical protein